VSPDGKYILVCTDKSRVILFRIHSAEQVRPARCLAHLLPRGIC